LTLAGSVAIIFISIWLMRASAVAILLTPYVLIRKPRQYCDRWAFFHITYLSKRSRRPNEIACINLNFLFVSANRYGRICRLAYIYRCRYFQTPHDSSVAARLSPVEHSALIRLTVYLNRNTPAVLLPAESL
jgi:hypothetical protein